MIWINFKNAFNMSNYVHGWETKGKFSSFIFQENNKTEIKFNQFYKWYLSFNMKTKQGFDILTFTAGSSELVSRSKVIGGGRVWPSYHKIKFWWMKKCASSYSLSATQMKWIFFFPSFHIKIFVNSFLQVKIKI